MLKLAIFDHDMTIVDSSYAIMEAFNYVAKHEGLPLSLHQFRRSVRGFWENTALNG